MSEPAPEIIKPQDQEPSDVRPGQNNGALIRRWEGEARFSCCHRMFAKVSMVLSVPDSGVVSDEKKIIEYLQNKGIDVKIGIEGWCRYCKFLETKVIAPGAM